MSIKLGVQDTSSIDELSRIGKNSLNLDGAYFITVTNGIADKSTTGDVIEGVNYTQGTFASDNESGAKKPVKIDPSARGNTYIVEIAGGTVTKADESKYYDLTDADTVNGTTESATTGQLQLIRFISATEGEFKIVNK